MSSLFRLGFFSWAYENAKFELAFTLDKPLDGGYPLTFAI